MQSLVVPTSKIRPITKRYRLSIPLPGVLVKPNPDSSCSFGSMEIPHTDNPFNALQFHIHTYSEHEIRGKGTRGFFPAELHVVHQEETKESFAVFGTMIDVGETAHPVFEDFLRGWERTAEQVAKECRPSEDPFAAVQTKVTCGTVNDVLQEPTVLPSGSFFPDKAPNVYGLPTTEDFGVFTYKGGLTTPGCTEIVNWNLLDEPLLISQEQLDRLEYLILCYVQIDDERNCVHATVADEEGSTSRPPQPLLGRRVIHRCPGGPEVEINDLGVRREPGWDFVPDEPAPEPSNTGDSKCTKTIFEDCSDDPRYNPRVSPNIKSAGPSWVDAEGFWVGKMRVYDSQGETLMETFSSDKFKNT